MQYRRLKYLAQLPNVDGALPALLERFCVVGKAKMWIGRQLESNAHLGKISAETMPAAKSRALLGNKLDDFDDIGCRHAIPSAMGAFFTTGGDRSRSESDPVRLSNRRREL